MSSNEAARQTELATALRASWTAETSATPADWSVANPAKGQCDASSFIYWQHHGGDLVLGQVFVNGEQTEHHYWNRIGGVDVDLTSSQFTGNEEIREVAVLDEESIRERQPTMRQELADRIELLRNAVSEYLAPSPANGQ